MSATVNDDNLAGTAGNDTINLLTGADTYQGLGGGDSVMGGAGADSLVGNDGADTLVGGGGIDGFSLATVNPFAGVDAGFYGDAAFADLDGDGDLDMVLAGTSPTFAFSTIITYQNTSGVFAPWAAGDPLSGIFVQASAVVGLGDIDADGDADLLIGASSGGLRVFRNNGIGTAPTELTGADNQFLNLTIFPITQNSFQDLTLEDFDNDGDRDLIFSRTSLWIYQNDGGVFSLNIPASYQTAFNRISSNAVTFLDIDNDGDKDLLGETDDGKIRVWRNDGSSHTELTGSDNPLNAINLGSGNRLRPVAADVNADGRDDLVIGRYDGTLVTYLQNQGDGSSDTLVGAGGNDSLVGTVSQYYYDYASYGGAAGAVTVDLQAGRTFESDGARDSLVGIGGVIGSGFGDSIRGSNADDELSGEAGNDTLTGGLGGIDLIDGGAGFGDLVYFEGAAISVALYGSFGDLAAVGSPHGASVSRGDSAIASVMDLEILQGTANNDFAQVNGTGTGSALLFDGAAGNDTVQSFTNSSWFFVDYRSGTSASGVTVDLFTGIGRDRHSGTDSLSGVLNAGGSSLSDVLLGNDGDNIFRPYDGLDSLNGGNGADMVDYTGAAGAVSVNLTTGRGFNAAGGDADTLISIENAQGGDGADTLFGSVGDNLLAGGAGNDSLVGTAGNDTLSYSITTNAITVNLDTGRAQDGLGSTDTLSGFEAALGSDYNDSILGSSAQESLLGGLGDDTIQGAGGYDAIDGGRGVDFLSGGDGNDTLYADSGGSSGYGMYSAPDTLLGGNGDDALFARLGSSFGPTTAVLYEGGDGRDTIDASFSSDTLLGGLGNDSLSGGGGVDSILGGDGNDNMRFASFGDATLLGEGGNDTITGEAFLSSSAFSISGGTGDDLLRLLSSSGLTISGGGGNDTLEFLPPSSSMDIFADIGRSVETGGVFGKEAPSFAGPELSLANVTGIEAINLVGSSLTLNLSAAIITAISDSGRLAIYGDASSIITFLDSGWVQGTTSDGLVTFTNGSLTLFASQSLVGGGGGGPTEGADILTGTASGEVINGLGGNDSISGLGGNDTLNGGSGGDTMNGGNGDDFFIVDDALDLILEAVSGSADTMITSVSYAMPNQVEQLMIAAGVTGITVTGGSGADIIIGNGLANSLNGGAGDDIILAQNIAVADISGLFALP